jgi:hypothetical protein
MAHDRELLARLTAFAPISFDGAVFRATRRGLDPLAPSTLGGRWMVAGVAPTLYTSTERDGALAEIVYHWGQLTPPPSKPVVVHTLGVRTGKTLKLGRAELIGLGIDWNQYGAARLEQTQAIGAAIAHLGYDGLIAPSARWACDNVMLFMTNPEVQDHSLILRRSEEVDWQEWGRVHSVL